LLSIQIITAPQVLVVVFIGSSPAELSIANNHVDGKSSILVEVCYYFLFVTSFKA